MTRFGEILPFGLLFKGTAKLSGNKQPPNGIILGDILINMFFLYFHLNKQFQSMVCCRYFQSSEGGLMLMFWILKLIFDEDIFAFFG